ncbi:MAG: hypothetical protein R2705_03625 [Ilumatobacteraceae bacterium]
MPGDELLDDADTVEIRPVISGARREVSGLSRAGDHRSARHNANFCAEHFLQLCRRQVTKAIEDHDMIAAGDRILVAVSGGKDSLAVWDILADLGYPADGLYIGLGIGTTATPP